VVYTIGKIDIYESYLDSDPDAAKGKTGSVWENLESVQTYFDNHPGLSDFRIYGVEADWDLDTEVIIGDDWRALTRAAKLIRLNSAEEAQDTTA